MSSPTSTSNGGQSPISILSSAGLNPAPSFVLLATLGLMFYAPFAGLLLMFLFTTTMDFLVNALNLKALDPMPPGRRSIGGVFGPIFLFLAFPRSWFPPNPRVNYHPVFFTSKPFLGLTMSRLMITPGQVWKAQMKDTCVGLGTRIPMETCMFPRPLFNVA